MFVCKLVIVGESGVGKTSLIMQYITGKILESTEPTLGASVNFKKITLEDAEATLEIWDTAGQERYNFMMQMYYRNAKAVVVVYDITDPSTFRLCKRWVSDVCKKAPPGILMVLVGNKSDLTDQRGVDITEAAAFATENGMLYMEASAKSANCVNDLFLAIAMNVPKAEMIVQDRGIDISKDSKDKSKIREEEKKRSCCK